jgi:hypothetical protein
MHAHEVHSLWFGVTVKVRATGDSMRITSVLSSPLFLAIVFATPCDAQQLRRAGAADSVATSIAEAQAQGRAYKRSTRKPTFPVYADTSAQLGRSDRVCVEIGSANIVRSGEFYAGPFVLYAENWHQFTEWSKLWWQPAHKPEPVKPFELTVRIALLDDAVPETYFYRSESHTASKKELAAIPDTPFFPSAIRLPHPGRWLMVPSMGSNWGCVIFTLK